ncbi:hypothetical protein ALC60_12529, partial [Trachymyrmex zeteki]
RPNQCKQLDIAGNISFLRTARRSTAKRAQTTTTASKVVGGSKKKRKRIPVVGESLPCHFVSPPYEISTDTLFPIRASKFHWSWDYFIAESDKKASYNLCKETIKHRPVTRLEEHLERKHKILDPYSDRVNHESNSDNDMAANEDITEKLVAFLPPPVLFFVPSPARQLHLSPTAINTKNSYSQPLAGDLLHMSSQICQSRAGPLLCSHRIVSPVDFSPVFDTANVCSTEQTL